MISSWLETTYFRIMTVHGLINTCEMYLKSLLELEEDGVLPLRARLADRLGQRMPTVSQTVQRLDRDGWLRIREARYIELTASGRQYAVRVMRKHRLAEVLLFEIIGLEWPQVHVEACRWEHVISDRAERHIDALCHVPFFDPFGNPIPGLAELRGKLASTTLIAPATRTAASAAQHGRTSVAINRIGEQLQDDVCLLQALKSASIFPGVSWSSPHARIGGSRPAPRSTSCCLNATRPSRSP